MSLYTLADKVTAWFARNPISTSRAYRKAFSGRTGDVLLNHIAHFCGATEPIEFDNPFEAARMAGRRDVWLMIQNMNRYTETEIREAQERLLDIGDES